MFEISITGTDIRNPYEELIKVFLQPSEYRIVETESKKDPNGNANECLQTETMEEPVDPIPDQKLSYHFNGDADALKREIYRDLSKLTGKKPKWGILTGIRPVKLTYELAYGAKAGTDDGMNAKESPIRRARRCLEETYLLHPAKADLAAEILEYQRNVSGDPADRSLSVYLGIPFCPTRCLYCSFTSNQVGEDEIERYLSALQKEIDYAGEAAAGDGFRVESVYFGGGTPTTLTAAQLDRLLGQVRDRFSLDHAPLLREFTVEAGRPDTIDLDKLSVLREHGVDRISINPQSMHQKTLDRIGRRHTVEQTRDAFRIARDAGFDCINTDLIAGLPEEDFSDFAQSLEEILSLGADNITLHTLAVKRASRLKEMDENFHYRAEELREEMLSFAAEKLCRAGMRPYYLYRQKHTSGNTENIGYCRDDKISVYNIRIMEERQSILALGAGGISKIWFPAENRLERVPNVSNYEIYIQRIDDMITRKRERFFGKTI